MVKLSNHMLRDVRAEIQCENGDVIIVKNAKNETRVELLEFIGNKLQESIDGKMTLNEEDIVGFLMSKLTNIEVDTFDLTDPSPEITKVIFYLSSIVNELTWEVLSRQNLQMHLLEKMVLEDDTRRILNDIQGMIKETQQRKFIKEETNPKKKPTKKVK